MESSNNLLLQCPRPFLYTILTKLRKTPAIYIHHQCINKYMSQSDTTTRHTYISPTPVSHSKLLQRYIPAVLPIQSIDPYINPLCIKYNISNKNHPPATMSTETSSFNNEPCNNLKECGTFSGQSPIDLFYIYNILCPSSCMQSESSN